MRDRWTVRVLDAKAAHRAWSKHRTLTAIVAAAIAASVALPATAFAGELADAGAQPVMCQETDVAQAPEAVASTSAIEGSVLDDAAAVDAASDCVSDQATENVATDTEEQDTVGVANEETSGSTTVAKGEGTADEGIAANDAADATEDDSDAGNSEDAVQNVEGEAVAESIADDDDVDQKTLQDAANDAIEKHGTDRLGTEIIFDFNGDGTTDAKDWKDYLAWMSEYRPFDFDLETGDLGDSHNGGIQITGATQVLVNGHGRRLDSIDTNLDVAGITEFYLNNIGRATSVKNQTPWGTCWSFASISTLESAILKAQYGITSADLNQALHQDPVLSGLDDKGVDLSELYLAWMANDIQHQGSQKGEGIKDVLPCDNDGSDRLNCGGWATMAEVLFGNWQGMATEGEQAYWPKGVPHTYEEFRNRYETTDKWGIDPQTGKPAAHVQDVYYLPDPNYLTLDRKAGKDGHLLWKGYDQNANKLIKQAIIKYGAVQIGYGADTSRDPNTRCGDYFNYDNWAQYCDATNIEITHAVTIVGWDDSYDARKFRAGKNDVSKIGNGAWLIKNSWGSGEWFMKNFGLSADYVRDHDLGWGLVDPKTGLHTGYFWLSYYDHSINTPSCFEVDVPDTDGNFKYDNNYSYDFLINQSQAPFVLRTSDAGTWVSNVFKARGNEILKAVTVHTSQPNSHARILVYLFDDASALDDNDPTNDGRAVCDMTYDAVLAGMHTVDLTKQIGLKPGQLFAIVENIVCDDGSGADGKSSLINLETGMAQKAQFPDPSDMETYGRAMGYLWSKAVANPGETFVRIKTDYGYMWLTPAQLSENYLGGNVFEFGNALIKAYTSNVETSAETDDATIDEPTDVQAIVAIVSEADGDEGNTQELLPEKAALPKTGDTTDAGGALALGGIAAAMVAGGVLVLRRHETD